jgi:Spy/CpxP family protein refolding chaperone
MKKIIFALCIACAFTPAMAQNGGTGAHKDGAHKEAHAKKSPEERAKHHAEVLKQKLNLTQDQYTKVLAVNMEVMKRKQALKAQSPKPEKGAFKEIGAYRREQFAAILSPAQMEQLKAFKAEQRQKHKHRMGMKSQRAKDQVADMPARSFNEGTAPRQ